MADRPSPSVRVTSDFDEEDDSASILRSPIDVSSGGDNYFFTCSMLHNPYYMYLDYSGPGPNLPTSWLPFFRSVPSWPRKDASLSSMLTEREITLRRMTAAVEYWTITPLTRFLTGTFSSASQGDLKPRGTLIWMIRCNLFFRVREYTQLHDVAKCDTKSSTIKIPCTK